MTPVTRFTMFNDTVSPSGTVVNQPLGWKDIAISLERDTEYHSLIEYFAGSFVWYGAAMEFIKLCEVTEGPVSKVRVLIEIKYNVTWDTLSDGKIDVSERENVSIAGTPYKYNAPIVRDDFWSRFISRRDTPVDLSASLDLDGNARTPITKIVLPLPSQKMDVSYRSTMFESGDTAREPIEFEMNFASNLRVFQLSLPIITKEGLENYWSIPAMVLVAPTPLTFGNEAPPNFTAKFKGSYTLDLSLFISTSPYSIPYGGGDQAPNLGLYIFKNGLFHANGTATNLGVNGTSGRTQFTYSDTFDLEVNESLTFYLYSGIGGDGVYFIVFNNWFAGEESYISLDGTTEFEDTETDAFLIKDAAESILSKIVGQDSVVLSTFFSTCKRLYAIMKLKHVRGYAFAQKAMFMTWNDWWKGAEPILNLGLGYSEVAGVKKIKIGSKEEFYNPTPIVFLNNVSGLTDTYDNTKHYNTITTGFETWSAESKSGIDDPQTKVTRAVPFFDTIGNKLDKLSKWYAASLGIESKRRLRVDLSKDDSLDETIAVIALKEDGADYLPEVGTDFASVGGLLNSDTRYNIRLTCGRIFKRWQKFIQGMLWFTSGLNFEFASGEGNYSVTSTLDDADCETDLGDQTLTESSAIAVDPNNYSYIPKQFKKARAPMAWETYKTIIANKENALGISAIDGSYLPMHIISLKFSLFKGYVDLTLLQASNSPVIPEGDYILMEDGNIILDENGDGILME